MRVGLFCSFFLLTSLACAAQAGSILVFAGTYTDSKPGKGIYVFSLNDKTGQLTPLATAENLVNPSFITVSTNGRYLYACTDTKTAVPGYIAAFAIDSITGHLHFINRQSSGGANPVYLATDKRNRVLVTGNYTGGSAAAFTINDSGAVSATLQIIPFNGSSINTARQEKPHIHSTVFAPGEEYVFMPDLGADKIRVMHMAPGSPQLLTEADSLTVNTVPGSGPRHMVFHPNKAFAYCVEEMGGTIAAYRYKKGRLKLMQRIRGNAHKAAEYSSADIHISPDGRFLYSSNRGENTIAIFSIGKNGWLTLRGQQSTFGDTPRNFAIDPTGHFLLVANQLSNSIIVFRRSPRTGLLYKVSSDVYIPSPSCLQLYRYAYQRQQLQ